MSEITVCIENRAQSLHSFIPSPHSVETAADCGVHNGRQRIKAESLAEFAQSFFEAAARGKKVQPIVEVYGSETRSSSDGAIEGVAGSGPIPIPARLRDGESAKADDGVWLQPQCGSQGRSDGGHCFRGRFEPVPVKPHVGLGDSD